MATALKDVLLDSWKIDKTSADDVLDMTKFMQQGYMALYKSDVISYDVLHHINSEVNEAVAIYMREFCDIK